MLDVQEYVRDQARFSTDPACRSHSVKDSVICGVDLAFTDTSAVVAVVAMRDGEIIERIIQHHPIDLPYIPGLLTFREAGPILAAMTSLSVTPDILLCDGNGRIHPREAGIATHIGVALDSPTIGIAKSLLCGTMVDPPPEPFSEGTRVPIESDYASTVIGYAVQTRQWDRPGQWINPVYVSPGHRIAADSAVDIVLAHTAGYKLPEPIRLADQFAGAAAREG